jgi:hypothetical protein
MASDVVTEVVLIVEKEANLSAQEKAIHKRLTERLKYHVTTLDASKDLSQSKGAIMAVVCAKHAPAEVRDLEIPVLVCNVESLYPLAMTMAKKDKDFGTMRYSSVLVGSEWIGAPQAAVQAGRRPIIQEQAIQGWARPGARALVLATVGGDDTKAVAFAYDKGDTMPGGLEAPARRGAFLAYGDAKGEFNADGWGLFEMVAQGIAEGGTWRDSPGLSKRWFLEDGKPTRSMAVEEYREWVHDKIANEVYSRLLMKGTISVGAIIAILGALWTWASNYISGSVKEAVAHLEKPLTKKVEEIDARQQAELKKLPKQVESQAGEETRKQMAEIVFNKQAGIWDQVKVVLLAKVKEDGPLQKDFVTAALPALKDVEQSTLAALLLDKYNALTAESAKSKSPELLSKKRDDALRLAIILATEKHRSELQDLLAKARRTKAEADHLVLITALENYEPPKSEDDRAEDLDSAAGSDVSHPGVQEAYGRFTSRFPDTYAPKQLEKLRKQDTNLSSKDLLLGIWKMQRPKKRASNAFDTLIEWAADGDAIKSEWAVKALELLLRENQQWNVEWQYRKWALDRLLGAINKPAYSAGRFIFSPALPRQAPYPVGSFSPSSYLPIGSSIPSSYLPTIHSTILISLLKPNNKEDQQYLKSRINMQTDSKATQALLFNWTARLEQQPEDQRTVPDGLVPYLLKVPHVLECRGSVRFLWHAIRYSKGKDSKEKEPYQSFLAELPNITLPKVYDEDVVKLFNLAVEQDAKNKFEATVVFLKSRDSLGLTEKQWLTERVKFALLSYSSSPQRDLPQLVVLQDALKTVDEDKELFDIFKAAFDQVERNALSALERTGNLDSARQFYDNQVKEANKAHWLVQRGIFRFEKLGEVNEALEDLTAAIDQIRLQFAPKTPPPCYYYYWETRGDYWGTRGDVRHSKPDDAKRSIDDFLEALSLLREQNDKGSESRRQDIYRKLGLQYIILDNYKEAEANTNEAVKAVKEPTNLRDKAGSKENLGLLYLRKKEWNKAYEHSKEVDSLNRFLAWNCLVRYIAAKESPDKNIQATAERAKQAWEALRVHNDLGRLYDYIPELLEKHLGVLKVIPGRLSGPPTMLTRFGKSVAEQHPFSFEKGKTYFIDMESTALDSYLILRTPDGMKIIKEDDNSGGARNARIRYDCDRPGNYLIVATSFRGQSYGRYKLIIRKKQK